MEADRGAVVGATVVAGALSALRLVLALHGGATAAAGPTAAADAKALLPSALPLAGRTRREAGLASSGGKLDSAITGAPRCSPVATPLSMPAHVSGPALLRAPCSPFSVHYTDHAQQQGLRKQCESARTQHISFESGRAPENHPKILVVLDEPAPRAPAAPAPPGRRKACHPGGHQGPSFAYSLPVHSFHARRDRVASLKTCRLHGAAIQRASPLRPGRALTLPCGWNNAGLGWRARASARA